MTNVKDTWNSLDRLLVCYIWHRHSYCGVLLPTRRRTERGSETSAAKNTALHSVLIDPLELHYAQYW